MLPLRIPAVTAGTKTQHVPERSNAFDPELTYFAVNVAGYGEQRACSWLKEASYATVAPSLAVEIRHAPCKHLVRRPAFPG